MLQGNKCQCIKVCGVLEANRVGNACYREACMSILSFLTRLFDPKLLLSCSPDAATHVRTSLSPLYQRVILPCSAVPA